MPLGRNRQIGARAASARILFLEQHGSEKQDPWHNNSNNALGNKKLLEMFLRYVVSNMWIVC